MQDFHIEATFLAGDITLLMVTDTALGEQWQSIWGSSRLALHVLSSSLHYSIQTREISAVESTLTWQGNNSS